MNLNNKKVCVIGCGKSGVGAVAFLKRQGAETFLFDANTKLLKSDIYAKMEENMREVPIYLGEIPEEIERQIQLVVVSPGVPTDTDPIEKFKKNKIPVWGEIELAWEYEKGEVIAITGTNGKTTTTTLVGEIMQDAKRKPFVVGNIGTPYTDEVENTEKDSVTVAEISSFQLETIENFHPKVSAILNITPDHLNRHHTMENYVAVKNAITKNQTKDDFCILNFDNGYTKKLGENCSAKVIYFSSSHELDEGIYLSGEDIYMAHKGIRTKLMNIHEMKLVGLCNVENVMAAIGIGLAMEVSLEVILETVKKFKAVEHRIEYTATVSGVDYYNDSKGTNPDAAIQGIKAMNRPTILIGGGYDKGSTYDEWIEAFGDKVKLLVLIGQTKEKIAACAKAHGFDKIVLADTFEEAFDVSVKSAAFGDAVLLSPACASWGMFPNYEVRGQLFKQMVHALQQSGE